MGGGEAVLGHKNSSVPFICSTDDTADRVYRRGRGREEILMGRQIDELSLLLLQFKTVTGPLSPDLEFSPCPSTDFFLLAKSTAAQGADWRG